MASNRQSLNVKSIKQIHKISTEVEGDCDWHFLFNFQTFQNITWILVSFFFKQQKSQLFHKCFPIASLCQTTPLIPRWDMVLMWMTPMSFLKLLIEISKKYASSNTITPNSSGEEAAQTTDISLSSPFFLIHFACSFDFWSHVHSLPNYKI